MNTFKHIIQDPLGMHARPAGLLARTAATFQSDIQLTAKGKTVNAKSIMSLMMLGLKSGDEMQFQLNGTDEVQAAEAIRAILP